jgi:hypothetical protein
MQRQFTIELRVDYADSEKNIEMKKALQHCARHALATAALLADGVKPQVAIFSDDFFSGNEEIRLLDDEIQQGLDGLDGTAVEEGSGFSSELMDAVSK